MEVPLMFPHLEALPRRFVINDTSVSFREERGVGDHSSSSPNRNRHAENFFDERAARAAASVSTLQGGIFAREAVLTTSLVLDSNKPGILAVSLVPATSDSPHVMIEIDIGSETSKLSSIVKVQAFYWNSSAQTTSIALLLIDSNASVMRVSMDPSTLQVSAVDLWNIPDILATKVGKAYYSAPNMRSSMVVALSATSLLIAPNPYLVAVDLAKAEVHLWSESRVLEEMKMRASKIGSLFKHGVDLVMGKVEQDRLIDMHPVSALCIAENDPSQIFSLHSDGAVRHWTMEPSKQPFQPWTVKELEETSVPPPESWRGSDPFCISMTSRAYDGTIALALHIHTHNLGARADTDSGSTIDRLNEGLFSQDAGHTLIVCGVSRDPSGGGSRRTSVLLSVPATALSLISMSFDLYNPRCSLLALFSAASGESAYYVTYPPSQVSLISKDPVLADSEGMLTGLAKHERTQISRLSYTHLLDQDGPFDDQLTKLDRYFLQYLFRPNFCRGIGLALPPSRPVIRRALQKVTGTLPDAFGSEVGHHRVSLERSLPVQVIQSLHSWRLRDLKKKRRTTFSLDGPDHGTPMVVEDDATESTELVLKSQERRWKDLLFAVWDEEQSMRAELCMSPSLAFQESRGVVIVRSGSMSVWQRASPVQAQNFQSPLSSLDIAMAELVSDVVKEENAALLPDPNGTLANFEVQVWAAVADGVIGVDTEAINHIKGSLNMFVANSMAAARLDSVPGTDYLLDMPEQELSDIIEQDSTLRHELVSFFSAAGSITLPTGSIPTATFSCTQHRAAVAGLTARSVERIRRILLGRLVALSALRGFERYFEPLLRMYMHCIAAMWTSAQQVDMRFTTKSANAADSFLGGVDRSTDGSSPPYKRQNLGHNGKLLSSIFAAEGTFAKTTSIDSLIIYLSGSSDVASENISLPTAVAVMGLEAAESLLSFLRSKPFPSSARLPELTAVPPSSNSITDDPKLALRLMSVYMNNSDVDENNDFALLRNELFAGCLLVVSDSERIEKGDAMVAQALHLLPFQPDDMESSFRHVQFVCQHLKGKARCEQHLTRYLRNAINMTPSQCSRELAVLWSNMFVSASALHNWDDAFAACMRTPDEDKKVDGLKRLARTMVDSGALLDLMGMCTNLSSDVETQMQSLSQKTDLYSIAVETLAENVGREHYSYLAVDPEPLSDYSGALYALHASQSQWQAAAATLEERFENARKALADGPSIDLGLDALSRRDSMIVDDLVATSVACVVAAKQTDEMKAESSAPVLSSSLPTFGLYSDQELTARAVCCIALRKLFIDRLGDKKVFASSILERDMLIDEFPVNSVVDQFFESGYYREGLVVAKARGSLLAGWPEGYDPFARGLERLSCSFLIPLAEGKALSLRRPTLGQLQSAFETTSVKCHSSALLQLRNPGTKIGLMHEAARRVGATALVHQLTVEFASPLNPLPIKVAESMLIHSNVSSWLEDFLCTGSSRVDTSGLFARRPIKNESAYLGDPSALLSLYTRTGRYSDGCHLVSRVLEGLGGDDAKKATSRLPEKGNMDFLPYNKIDLLWNLIEEVIGAKILDDNAVKDLLSARNKMEGALERHFALLKVSEDGLRSARALF